MSNLDAHPVETPCRADSPGIDRLLQAREVPLGGARAMHVSRTLPQRALPTVGAWCFLDRFGPEHTDMLVPPHPHTGLQTVTWPLRGRIRHRDSLGNDVIVKPGQLNLMTSGLGISHSEVSVGDAPLIHGLQLWVALPDGGRTVAPSFEQHTDLPRIRLGGAHAVVVVGGLADAVSPATTHTPLLGAQLDLDAGGRATVPLRADFEHAVLVLEGAVSLAGTKLEPGPLQYLDTGRKELVLSSQEGAKLLLIGGEPFPDDLVMWWNFVGRSHEDVVAAREAWEAPGHERFGVVEGHGAERIPAPPMPALRLSPRRRR